jgi:hypothetical protein
MDREEWAKEARREGAHAFRSGITPDPEEHPSGTREGHWFWYGYRQEEQWATTDTNGRSTDEPDCETTERGDG